MKFVTRTLPTAPFVLWLLVATVTGQQSSKVDSELTSLPPDQMVNVMITLRDQPQMKIAAYWAKEYAGPIENAEEQLRYASGKANPAGLRDARAGLEQSIRNMRRRTMNDVKQRIQPAQDSVETLLRSFGAIHVERYWISNTLHARLRARSLTELARHEEVAAVTPVHSSTLHLDKSTIAIKARAFWNEGYRGEGEAIAVLDSGIKADHPAFAGKEVVARVFAPAAVEEDVCHADDGGNSDVSGHGTHVAGIAAGSAFPQSPAHNGVARGAGSLYIARVFYKRREDESQKCDGRPLAPGSSTLSGLQWVVEETPAKVLNYSAGSPTFTRDANGRITPRFDDSDMARVFDSVAEAFGITMVVAAGNDGPSAQTLGAPGIAYNVITVANWDASLSHDPLFASIHATSSRGPTAANRSKPDIAAPGHLIAAAWHKSDGLMKDTGTSMSAPHVAGAAALLRQAGISDPLEIKALLLNSAVGLGWRSDRGWGYMNLANAYEEKSNVHNVKVPAGGFVLYSATATGNAKATVVWNRHITGEDAIYNPLGVYAYSAANRELASSASGRNNVEQVAIASAQDVLIKVKPLARFDDALEEEPVAIAASNMKGLTRIQGPRLRIACSTPSNRVLAGVSYEVRCAATNEGDYTAAAVRGVVTAPQGYTSPRATLEFGNLAPNQSATQIWLLTAPPRTEAGKIRVTASSSMLGETFRAFDEMDVSVDAPELRASASSIVLRMRASTRPVSSNTEPFSISSSGAPVSFTIRETNPSAPNVGFTLQYMLQFTWSSTRTPASLTVRAVNQTPTHAGTIDRFIEITSPSASNSPLRIPVKIEISQ